MVPVVFAKGGEEVTVYATAGRHQRHDLIGRYLPDGGGWVRKEVPDFGLYADKIWEPVGRNEFISWPDYSVPLFTEVAYLQIIDAYIRACYGERVEVGCIGAHGRTGTILACMAVLTGIPAAEAVAWVKNNYCEHAVETKQQELWVQSFALACC